MNDFFPDRLLLTEEGREPSGSCRYDFAGEVGVLRRWPVVTDVPSLSTDTKSSIDPREDSGGSGRLASAALKISSTMSAASVSESTPPKAVEV